MCDRLVHRHPTCRHWVRSQRTHCFDKRLSWQRRLQDVLIWQAGPQAFVCTPPAGKK